MADPKDNYRLYMKNAREMLEVAKLNLENEYYGSACNRAYYAVFYAASAVLYSKGMAYGKHSAVIAAFRQHFVKTGEFKTELSDIYEFIMTSRQISDYDLDASIEKDQAKTAITDAETFVEEVERWLRKHKLI